MTGNSRLGSVARATGRKRAKFRPPGPAGGLCGQQRLCLRPLLTTFQPSASAKRTSQAPAGPAPAHRPAEGPADQALRPRPARISRSTIWGRRPPSTLRRGASSARLVPEQRAPSPPAPALGQVPSAPVRWPRSGSPPAAARPLCRRQCGTVIRVSCLCPLRPLRSRNHSAAALAGTISAALAGTIRPLPGRRPEVASLVVGLVRAYIDRARADCARADRPRAHCSVGHCSAGHCGAGVPAACVAIAVLVPAAPARQRQADLRSLGVLVDVLLAGELHELVHDLVSHRPDHDPVALQPVVTGTLERLDGPV